MSEANPSKNHFTAKNAKKRIERREGFSREAAKKNRQSRKTRKPRKKAVILREAFSRERSVAGSGVAESGLQESAPEAALIGEKTLWLPSLLPPKQSGGDAQKDDGWR